LKGLSGKFQRKKSIKKMLKTKIRCLYDIANVFHSIVLIEKTHIITNLKPAFCWIGIQGVHCAIEEIIKIVNSGDQQRNALFLDNT